jgi:catechol 2,3-dioxygenase-like lactoylglutathione lyase family enzyme
MAATGSSSTATATAADARHDRPIAQRLHHHAIVVADQEATRRFYEDLIGLPLTATWCETENIRGKDRVYCHTFYELADGSALAFFQFADPDDYEALASNVAGSLNHIALSVTAEEQHALTIRLESQGVGYRIVDHGYCRSLYVSDPDGSTLELTVDPPNAADIAALRRGDAHSELARWLAGDHRPNNDLRALGSA